MADRLEPRPELPHGTIDALQSMLLAFIVAIAFKHFVAETYVIPTGSMAPTLLGAHFIARGSDSGYEFHVGPNVVGAGGIAPTYQGTDQTGGPFQVEDPMLANRIHERRRSGPSPIVFRNVKTRMGDRIFVLRYLYHFFEPKRFDVVVFKNPTDPAQNMIKRLIGLPGEILWLLDGDVFAAPAPGEEFVIQRKPADVQREVWQPVYHSDYIPVNPEIITPRWSPPWTINGEPIEAARSYRLDSATLEYRTDVKPIVDWVPYNSSSHPRMFQQDPLFAVSDVRVAAAIEADGPGWSSALRLTAREHEFEARLAADGRAGLWMRPVGGEWTELANGEAPVGEPGEATPMEFWHVDQALWLWVDGELVAYAEYDWPAATRSVYSTGVEVDEARAMPSTMHPYLRHLPEQPRLAWTFTGSPVTLHHVQLDRDLYYRPATYYDPQRRGLPALGTHPANLAELGEDQFFMAGDNSPSSNDARLWDPPVPWIAAKFDAEVGVVHRRLLLGKAFFVYYPSPENEWRNRGLRFVPNFGEMRFIR